MHSKHEHNIKNDSNSEELSLAEQVFQGLQIYRDTFNPVFFSCKDLSALSLTSKTLYHVARPELNKRQAQILLNHVILGEETKAQAMIEKKPELLSIRTEAVDYSGRIIVGTAFQAAIGAGDKPMWTMMLPYFEGLEQGEAATQFHEQFPNGIEDEVSAVQLKDYYNAIALAIINDEDKGLSKIAEFREDITRQKEIKQGKHFNLQHLIAAYQACIDKFDDLANWNNRDLFWQQVIGYVQRQMTAYDAQVHCSGIKSMLEDKNVFQRTFEIFLGGNFFPLSDDKGLGFDSACLSFMGPGMALLRQTQILPQLIDALGNYIEQKQMQLQELESHLSKEQLSCPIANA